MKVELDNKTIKAIAKEVVKILQGGEQEEKLLTSKQAAEILGISKSRLYQIKDKLPYVKIGNNKQSPIRFKAATLKQSFLNM